MVKAPRLRDLSCLFLLLLILVSHVSIVESGKAASNPVASEQVPLGGILRITQTVYLSEKYHMYERENRNEVVVDVYADALEGFSIFSSLTFSRLEVEGLPTSWYNVTSYGYPPQSAIIINFTESTTNLHFRLRGYIETGSFIWRNLANIRFFNVTEGFPEYIIQSTELVVIFPDYADIRLFYTPAQDLDYQTVQIGQTKAYIVQDFTPGASVITLYEPARWESYAQILLVILLIAIISISFLRWSGKTVKVWKERREQVLKSLRDTLKRLEPLYNKVMSLNSSRFFKVYMTCGIIMVSLCFSFGPDPRMKVYILSETHENADELSSIIQQQTGAYTITVFDEMTDFKTLADIGMFNVIIVGDFGATVPVDKVSKNFIFPALEIGPKILILQQFNSSLFAEEVMDRYEEKTAVVEIDDLGNAIGQIQQRRNAFGLSVDTSIFWVIMVIIAILSFVIIFLSYAFLVSRLLEIGKRPGFTVFMEAIAYGILVFTFNQLVYIACSVLLAVPLGLHASIPKLTVIGVLGFGGGSIPRMLVGILGIFYGSIVSMKSHLKLDIIGILAFAILSIFILVDPLTNGLIFYEFIILFLAGSRIDVALSTWSSFRVFLDYFTSSFGSWVSPTYNASLGITLYYLGTTLIGLFPKINKTTATVMLFFSAISIAQGGIRVAEMTPWRAVASVIPGVVVGLFFVVVFFSISLFEGFVRKKLA